MSDRIHHAKLDISDKMENKIRICISGMIAVGKSTLARALAKDFDMELISEAKLGISYLERLFEDPARWGYEAQAAFLVGKANAIRKIEKKHKSYILDRSIFEDANIFFEYFKEANKLDELTCLNYQYLYEFIDAFTPKEDISIICTIDYESVVNRIVSRNKFNAYVEGYVDSIYTRYTKFIEERRGNQNTYICDGNIFDWTNDKICKLIAEDVHRLINHEAPNLDVKLNVLRAHV